MKYFSSEPQCPFCSLYVLDHVNATLKIFAKTKI